MVRAFRLTRAGVDHDVSIRYYCIYVQPMRKIDASAFAMLRSSIGLRMLRSAPCGIFPSAKIACRRLLTDDSKLPSHHATSFAQTDHFDFDSPGASRGRHLLRAILRESTYLPDSHAREYIHQYAIRRFRDYGYKAWQHRTDPDFADRLKGKRHEAQQAVNRLRRATEGELNPLRAVLFMAYGRTGRRRRELVANLVHAHGAAEFPDVAEPVVQEGVDNQDPSAQISSSAFELNGTPAAEQAPSLGIRKPKSSYMPHITPRLRALAESQIKYPPPHMTRPLLRRMHPVIPELNTWLRPMPQVRVKNMTRKWYAELLDKVHPPLPTAEWTRLCDLAGGMRVEKLPLRRKAVVSASRSALDLVLASSRINSSQIFPNRRANSITQRYMRRLWVQIFEQSPRMDWDAAREDWTVTWGSHAIHSTLEQNPSQSLSSK